MIHFKTETSKGEVYAKTRLHWSYRKQFVSYENHAVIHLFFLHNLQQNHHSYGCDNVNFFKASLLKKEDDKFHNCIEVVKTVLLT